MILNPGVVAAAGGGIAGDPHFSNVSLLLQPMSADSSIVDLSPQAHTITGQNSPTLVTSPTNRGEKAINLGSTGYLTLTGGASLNLGTGDFTVEAIIRSAFPSSYHTLVGFSGNGLLYSSHSAGAGVPNFYTGGVGHSHWSGGFTANTYQHIAMCRASGQTEGWINGARQFNTASLSSESIGGTGTVYVGAQGGGNTLQGYIDALRITKGVARYTGATIDVPTEFPTS